MISRAEEEDAEIDRSGRDDAVGRDDEPVRRRPVERREAGRDGQLGPDGRRADGRDRHGILASVAGPRDEGREPVEVAVEVSRIDVAVPPPRHARAHRPRERGGPDRVVEVDARRVVRVRERRVGEAVLADERRLGEVVQVAANERRVDRLRVGRDEVDVRLCVVDVRRAPDVGLESGVGVARGHEMAVDVECLEVGRHLFVPRGVRRPGLLELVREVDLVEELPREHVRRRAPPVDDVAQPPFQQVARGRIREEVGRLVARSAVPRVVGVLRPLRVRVRGVLAVVVQTELDVDALRRGVVDHLVEQERLPLPSGVVAEPGVLPLDGERPRGHPDADVVAAARRQPVDPSTEVDDLVPLAPSHVLADREVGRTVVELQVASPGSTDEASAGGLGARERLGRRRRRPGRVGAADHERPHARLGRREADLPDGIAARRRLTRRRVEREVLEVEAGRRDRRSARRGEERGDRDLPVVERVVELGRRADGDLEPLEVPHGLGARRDARDRRLRLCYGRGQQRDRHPQERS